MMQLSGTFKFGIPTIYLKVENVSGSFLVDTGFNGELMLPLSVIQQFGLQPIGVSEYLTAGGDLTRTFAYAGIVNWFGNDKKATILAGPEGVFLSGMDLLHDASLVVERSKEIVSITKVN